MTDNVGKLLGRTLEPPLRYLLPLLVVLGPAAACEDVTDPPPATPLEIVIESGDEQVGEAGDTLPEPLVAKVIRPDGSISQRGMWVELVDGGGADLGTARGSGEGVVLKSPTLGTISVGWVLSGAVGTQRLRLFALELYGDTVDAFATAEAAAPDPTS